VFVTICFGLCPAIIREFVYNREALLQLYICYQACVNNEISMKSVIIER